LNGNQVKLSSLRGRPVLVNFWATWCPPCRAEIPTLVQAYAETGGADRKEAPYEIVGIATQSDLSTIKAFVNELGISFPVLNDADNRVTNDLYHVVPIPTSFFVDRDGVIRYIQIGVLDRAALDKWLLN
jgi:thiol-disulfide isomerase/thioredoxin